MRRLSPLKSMSGTVDTVREIVAELHLAENSCVGRRYVVCVCGFRGELAIIREDALVLNLEVDILQSLPPSSTSSVSDAETMQLPLLG